MYFLTLELFTGSSFDYDMLCLSYVDHSYSIMKTTLTVVAIAASVFGLMLVGIFIVKLRKCMLKETKIKLKEDVTFHRKKGVDNKAVEIETSSSPLLQGSNSKVENYGFMATVTLFTEV